VNCDSRARLPNFYLIIPNLPNNIHNLKNRQNCTSAVPEVNVHNLPNAHKVPNQHIIYITCSGWHAQPVRSMLCQFRLHHVSASSPKVLGPAWQVWISCCFGDLIFGESVLTAVLHRSQHRPRSPKQAQTRPDGSTYSIVQGTPASAEIGPIYFGLWCAQNGPKPIVPLFIYWDPFGG
jgi:hypothetical protein